MSGDGYCLCKKYISHHKITRKRAISIACFSRAFNVFSHTAPFSESVFNQYLSNWIDLVFIHLVHLFSKEGKWYWQAHSDISPGLTPHTGISAVVKFEVQTDPPLWASGSLSIKRGGWVYAKGFPNSVTLEPSPDPGRQVLEMAF